MHIEAVFACTHLLFTFKINFVLKLIEAQKSNHRERCDIRFELKLQQNCIQVATFLWQCIVNYCILMSCTHFSVNFSFVGNVKVSTTRFLFFTATVWNKSVRAVRIDCVSEYPVCVIVYTTTFKLKKHLNTLL